MTEEALSPFDPKWPNPQKIRRKVLLF